LGLSGAHGCLAVVVVGEVAGKTDLARLVVDTGRNLSGKPLGLDKGVVVEVAASGMALLNNGSTLGAWVLSWPQLPFWLLFCPTVCKKR